MRQPSACLVAFLIAGCGSTGEIVSSAPQPPDEVFPLPSADPAAQLAPALMGVENEPQPAAPNEEEPAIDPVEATKAVRWVNGAEVPIESDLAPVAVDEMFMGDLTLPGGAGRELTGTAPAPNPSKVFGSDGRRLVARTIDWPARAFVKIIITWPNGQQGGCSGTMIGRKSVLTAGHCIYNPERGGWARETLVIPGLDGTYMPFGSATQVYIDSVKGWTNSQNNDYDYALITLNRNLGDATGWLGLASLSNGSLDGLNSAIQGYPGDLSNGSQQYVHSGPIEDYDSTMIYYDIDTMPGDSGAVLHGASGGWHDYIFGVHTGSSWFWLTEYNRATRINNDRYYQILGWINNRAGLGTVGGDHTGWAGTGGASYTPPTTVKFAGSRWDSFVRGMDGAVWWKPSTAGGWTSLGGQITDSVGAVSRLANQLDLFVRGGDGAIWTKALGGTVWWPAGTGWARLGGNITGSPVAVSYGANRLDVFARGVNGDVVWTYWAGGGWSAPASLGGQITDHPTAVSWGPNRIDLFARQTNGNLIHLWYDGLRWSSWENLGGYLSGAPTAVAPGGIILEVFGVGGDSAVWHRRYENGWRDWESLGGAVSDEIAAAVRMPGQIDLFVRDVNGGVFTKARSGGGAWWPGVSSWAYLGGDILGPAAVVSTASNHLSVLTRGSDNQLRVRSWNGATW